MKIVFVGINSKYIHQNLAIRLLKSNLKYDSDIIEFNIKDTIDYMLDKLKDYDIIGISTYIWNALISKELIRKLKKLNKIIIAGGPEATYRDDEYLDIGCDYVIKNEGEIAIQRLIEAIILNKPKNDILNLSTKEFKNPCEEIMDLDSLKKGYDLYNDNKNRIAYIETSRGCPYKCAYCMASLEKHVRYFNLDEIKKDIMMLMEKGTKVFKFLDRTFNADKRKCYEIFDFIIKNHYPNTSFQFEITGDILPEEIIDYLNTHAPKHLFRFEIGIQSTNLNTNKLVNRIQNNEKLFNNIRKIQDKDIIDLHLDLIAGLPKEDIISFEKTFNDCIALRPKELQLGFLKLLKGTKMYEDAPLYKYEFSTKAPYEIIRNDSLSNEDITLIHKAEEILEKYYNSNFMPKTIRYIFDNVDSEFKFLMDFGIYYFDHFDTLRYKYEDLFIRLYEYLKLINFNNLDYLLFIMKYDYLNHFNMKPKLWFEKTCNRNETARMLHNTILSSYKIDDLYKYSLFEKYNNLYLFAYYKPNEKEIRIIDIEKIKFKD